MPDTDLPRTVRGETYDNARVRGIVVNEFFASYLQPVYDIRTLTGFGYELLNRPYGMNTEPFYRRALQRGYGTNLNGIALRRACAIADVVTTPVFVNVFPSSLAPGDLESAATRKLVLEFSEQDSLPDIHHLRRETMTRRIRVALDDFGTGHANLRALVELEPSFIKLDRTIVSRVHTSPLKQAAVRALIELSHGRFSLVAEGIEEPEELALLANLGVPYGQGYLLGKPKRLAYRFG